MRTVGEAEAGETVTLATGQVVEVVRQGRMGTSVRPARKRAIVIKGAKVGEADSSAYTIASGTELLERRERQP